MGALKISEENFENEVVNSQKTIIVDFYADWCGPCKMMSPIIEKIADEVGENVKVCKVNVDENMNLAEQYGIMSIPTIIVFKNGNIATRFTGVTNKDEILKALN